MNFDNRSNSNRKELSDSVKQNSGLIRYLTIGYRGLSAERNFQKQNLFKGLFKISLKTNYNKNISKL